MRPAVKISIVVLFVYSVCVVYINLLLSSAGERRSAYFTGHMHRSAESGHWNSNSSPWSHRSRQHALVSHSRKSVTKAHFKKLGERMKRNEKNMKQHDRSKDVDNIERKEYPVQNLLIPQNIENGNSYSIFRADGKTAIIYIPSDMHLNISFKTMTGTYKRNYLTKKLSTKAAEVQINHWTEQTSGGVVSSVKTVNDKFGFVKLSQGVQIYSAFYDARTDVHFVRIVALMTKVKRVFWCHFRGPQSAYKAFGTKGEIYQTCEGHRMMYTAYIISCPVPRNISLKSILENDFILTYKLNRDLASLRVKIFNGNYNEPFHHGNLSICIPPLYGNISAVHLLEFIEFHRSFGAEKFTFYVYNIPRKIQNLLDYYQYKGIVNTLPWKFTTKPKFIWNYGQSASVWDCLFRSMYQYRHVAFIDTDEFIVPRNRKTWLELKEELLFTQQNKSYVRNIAAFSFKSVFFPVNHELFVDSFTTEFTNTTLRTLTVLNRTSQQALHRNKLIVDPVTVFELGIHHLSKPLREQYTVMDVDPKVALLHHYRHCDVMRDAKCVYFLQQFTQYEMDNSTFRYKNELTSAINSVLRDLQKLNFHVFK